MFGWSMTQQTIWHWFICDFFFYIFNIHRPPRIYLSTDLSPILAGLFPLYSTIGISYDSYHLGQCEGQPQA